MKSYNIIKHGTCVCCNCPTHNKVRRKAATKSERQAIRRMLAREK